MLDIIISNILEETETYSIKKKIHSYSACRTQILFSLPTKPEWFHNRAQDNGL